MRIAMWSGPRNLSTAMMYSFGARRDCAVVDEPFYATYLAKTGLNHPMRAEILASQSDNPSKVIDALLGETPEGRDHFYQKHMTHHMVDGIPRDWIAQTRNVFLIRHPARVVASFSAKYENPTLSDIGFVQQAELFDQVSALGGRPVVIDSSDILRAPETMLKRLCLSLDLPWDPMMLHWPSGGHRADGIWAAHWYGTVHNSTGFGPPEHARPRLTGAAAALANSAMPAFEKLSAQKI